MKSILDWRAHESPGTESSLSGFVDTHMHVLPGMDDGSADMATSLDMLRVAVEGGTCAVCATPHAGGPDYDRGRLFALVEELNSAAQKEEIPIHVFSGAEYQLDEWMIDHAEKGHLVTLGKSRNVLIELPFTQIPAVVWQMLFEIQARGYHTIIAHPERNADIQQRPSIAAELIHKGCMLQVSGSSITGEHGKVSRKAALSLIANGSCHAVASDGHAPTGDRGSSLANSYKQVTRRFSASLAWKLFSDTPRLMMSSDDS